MSDYQRENLSHITSIIFTVFFLVIASSLWLRVNRNYKEINSFLMADVSKVPLVDTLLTGKNTYAFSITSNYSSTKEYDVSLVGLDNLDYTIDVVNGNNEGIINPKETLTYELVLNNELDTVRGLDLVIEFR